MLSSGKERLRSCPTSSRLHAKSTLACRPRRSVPQVDAEKTVSELCAQISNVPEHLALIASLPELTSSNAPLVEDLKAESSHVRQQRAEAEKAILSLQSELEDLWKDSHTAEYELSSVFMHRGTPSYAYIPPLAAQVLHLGSASFGHYWLHQRALPDEPERWLKFNDASVRRTLQ